MHKRSKLILKQQVHHSEYSRLRAYLSISDTDVKNFEEEVKLQVTGCYARGNLILQTPGQECTKLWFVTSGVVFAAYLDDDDRMTFFKMYLGTEMALDMQNFTIKQNNCSCYLIACHNTHMLQIERDAMAQIQEKYPESLCMQSKLLATEADKTEKRDHILRLNLDNKILLLNAIYPGVISTGRKIQVPYRYLASWVHSNETNFSKNRLELITKGLL